MKMDYQQICKNEEISLLIEKGNENITGTGIYRAFPQTRHEGGGDGRKDPEGAWLWKTEDRTGKDRRIYA